MTEQELKNFASNYVNRAISPQSAPNNFKSAYDGWYIAGAKMIMTKYKLK